MQDNDRKTNTRGQLLRFMRPNRAGPIPPIPPIPNDRGDNPAPRFMEPDVEADADYRHRMLMNGITIVVCVLLIGLGIWLAVKMADLTRDENCVLGGRRNCAGIDIRGPHPGASDVR